jgi:hypothetical protein
MYVLVGEFDRGIRLTMSFQCRISDSMSTETGLLITLLTFRSGRDIWTVPLDNLSPIIKVSSHISSETSPID